MKKTILPLFTLLGIFCVGTGNAQLRKTISKGEKVLGCQSVDVLKTFAIDTTKTRGMADNYYLWDNGKTLKVKFMNQGYSVYKAHVIKYAKEWEKYGNIKFDFVEDGDAQIRVMLGDKKEGYGHVTMGIGTLALSRAADEFTIHLDTTHLLSVPVLYSTVVHEFGHALGLEHEHQYPASGIKWNKEKIYAEYAKEPNKWDRQKVDAQLFGNYSMMHTNGTQYDPKSIMHYPIMASETLDGYSVGWNYSISEGDKQLIALLYPKYGNRVNEVARFSVSDYTSMQIETNNEKQGLSLYPSLNITPVNKQAQIFLIAFFYDKDGKPVQAPTDPKKTVYTYRDFFLPVNKKIPLNKGQKSCELFLPYSSLPLVNGINQFAVEFRVMLIADNEPKIVFYSKQEKVTITK